MLLPHAVRYNRFVLYTYRLAQNLRRSKGWGGFHGDKVYQGVVLELLKQFPFTSFVETGTSRGYSTELVAMSQPRLPVYTSEILPSTFKTARMALRHYPNIEQRLGSSDAVVGDLIREGKVGRMPLYYLDAHWEAYWPLRDELRLIADAGGPAAIIIDDFQVPGAPQFGFDTYPAAEGSVSGNCDLSYIIPALGKHSYQAAYPTYNRVDAFPPSGGTDRDPLRGHIVLFQNMTEEFKRFIKSPFGSRYYRSQDVPA